MIDWRVKTARSNAKVRGHKPHLRRDEERANSLALVITVSLFVVLFASALMVGTHLQIGPVRRTTTREANIAGEIVYTMPGGILCRHMTFDNATGEISKADIERCPGDADAPRSTGFKWNLP